MSERRVDDFPLVAIVGRPNVGKSTLFNRLVGGRPALVEDEPGVTRDRRYGEAEFGGRKFRVVDTGGLDPAAETGAITAGIHRQAQRAIEEADLIVFVADARDGVTRTDRDVATLLRRSRRPVLVAANKVDGAAQEVLAAEIYELGLGEVIPVSAVHGRGARELLDEILARLPDESTRPPSAPEEEVVEGTIRVAFVGRPNVGKSSLVNRLLGEDRVLVHDQPGTTTDPVDTLFEYQGQDYVLVDTAGIRKRARVEKPTEKLASAMALSQIARSDVAALVIDAELGPSDQDAKIGGAIEEAGRAVMIVVNKSDLLGTGRKAEDAERELRKRIRDELPFLSFAPIRFVSAKSGRGVADLIADATTCYHEHGKRITTAQLNRFFRETCETHPPPTFRGKAVRIYYLTQPAAHPPTFVLWANRPELVHYGYRRFLMNRLREQFGFQGTPVRIVTRRRARA
ncbi:MAG: ribosome biogenesis GTPase Der [Deltaproteobacteria bacterium]|nr:ribosome biogenesis GTPase Der [Deltaproteobacteria bacterium]